MPNTRPITTQQKVFIAEYLRTFNGTHSARVAKYKGDANSLAVTAHRLLRNIKIKAEIERQLADLIMPKSEVLARLTQHAEGTLTPFTTSDGHIDLSTPDAQSNIGLLKKLKIKDRHYGSRDDPIFETETEIELHDPQAALVQLGWHHKLFTDRTEIDDTGLSDEERAKRIAAILDAARTRRDGPPSTDS